MSLLATQRDFATWLRDGSEGAADRMGSIYRPGLAVYLNNYRSQLMTALETSFAHTLAWMGDGAFHDAAITHIDMAPPSGWTLDGYGRDFPMTLAALQPDAPEVAELAWTEWAIGEVFVAPDHDVADAASLADVDWDHAVLQFSPAIRFAEVSTNVFDIWLALTEERWPPSAIRLPARQAIIVWRNGYSCQVRTMDPVEANALRLSLSGAPFPRMCEVLVASNGEERGLPLAGNLLGRWIGEGLLIGTSSIRALVRE